MLVVIRATDDVVLKKWDAWYVNAYEDMIEWVFQTGRKIVGEEITSFGDMLVYVDWAD